MPDITHIEWAGFAVKASGYARWVQRGIRVCKVSEERHPVLLDMANITHRTVCRRNQGCWIYKITGKFIEPGEQSCQT